LKRRQCVSIALNFSTVPHVHWFSFSFSLMNSRITSAGRVRLGFSRYEGDLVTFTR